VEAAPSQTVETRGDAGFDDAIVIASRRLARGSPRNNCGVTHGGHAALLQCLPHANCRDFALQLLPFEKTTRERLGIQCSKLSSMKSVILEPATLNQRLRGMRVPATGQKEPIRLAAVFR
jgi:hypothetical protein